MSTIVPPTHQWDGNYYVYVKGPAKTSVVVDTYQLDWKQMLAVFDIPVDSVNFLDFDKYVGLMLHHVQFTKHMIGVYEKIIDADDDVFEEVEKQLIDQMVEAHVPKI